MVHFFNLIDESVVSKRGLSTYVKLSGDTVKRVSLQLSPEFSSPPPPDICYRMRYPLGEN